MLMILIESEHAVNTCDFSKECDYRSGRRIQINLVSGQCT